MYSMMYSQQYHIIYITFAYKKTSISENKYNTVVKRQMCRNNQNGN